MKLEYVSATLLAKDTSHSHWGSSFCRPSPPWPEFTVNCVDSAYDVDTRQFRLLSGTHGTSNAGVANARHGPKTSEFGIPTRLKNLNILCWLLRGLNKARMHGQFYVNLQRDAGSRITL